MTERDPRRRPADPAGTRPKHDPEDLLPRSREPLLWGGAAPGAAAGTEAAGTDVLRDEDVLFPGGPPSPAAEPAPLRPEPQVPRGVLPRIQFLTGALLAFGIAGLVALALVVLAPEDEPGPRGPQWSTWMPQKGLGDAPTQIARHVGRRYRLTTGEQLVAVTGGPLEIADLPLTIAMRNAAGDIDLVEGGGVLYRLCGLGPQCAIDKGKPSTQRHLLLRREALELALFSFRYLRDTEHVVVFMPPRKGQEPSQALFFRRSDLAGSLARPLTATLAPRTPNPGSVARSPDAALVNTVTARGLFQFSLTQGNQDARAFLVLEPLEQR